MILVDDSAGSKDLFPFIKSINPDTILTRISPPFGDIVWVGEADGGGTTNVAVEYKKLNDVMDCMIDGRFSGHQLPGLLATHEGGFKYGKVYLLVEYGRVRPDRQTGILQRFVVTRKGGMWVDIQRNGRGFTYRDLEHWYTTMEEFPRLTIVRTYDEWESARWVVSKYSWWVGKGWDEHRSYKQFHTPPPPTAALSKPGFCRSVVKEFPDIKWERSGPVAEHFGSVFNAVNADVDEWSGISMGVNSLGHKLTIGPNRARKIWEALRRRW